MSRGLLAGGALALLLLAAGPLLGTLRIFVLAPRLGPDAALALELPVMLAIAWVATSRRREPRQLEQFGTAAGRRRRGQAH